jgi:hypothetical protein
VVAGLFSFGIGFYSSDLLFMAIGVLLALASVLIFLEIKKMDNDPVL